MTDEREDITPEQWVDILGKEDNFLYTICRATAFGDAEMGLIALVTGQRTAVKSRSSRGIPGRRWRRLRTRPRFSSTGSMLETTSW